MKVFLEVGPEASGIQLCYCSPLTNGERYSKDLRALAILNTHMSSTLEQLATGWIVRVLNPGRFERFSLFRNFPDWFWDTCRLLLQGTAFCPGLKRHGFEVRYISPSSEEFKN